MLANGRPDRALPLAGVVWVLGAGFIYVFMYLYFLNVGRYNIPAINVKKRNPLTHINFSDVLILLFDKTSINPKIRIINALIAPGAITKSAKM